MNKQRLIDFQKRIAIIYKQGKIKAPVHLSNGNEDELICIFKNIKKGDYIFSTHRSHYHYLLSGGSEKKLEKMILGGDSMHIYDRDIPFFTSAIVAGTPAIAVGVAMALKMKKSKSKVWCFIGDMSYMCGITKESIRYSEGFDLPITFIIEDNGLSVNAPTQKIWGIKNKKDKVIKYKYKRGYPHHGIGKWVNF